jgi:hypothetical protein
MKSFIAALRNLVLPWGQTSGRRIVLDGDNGRINGYNASDQLVWQLRVDPPVGLAVGADTGPQVGIIANGTVGQIILPTNRPVENQPGDIIAAVGNSGAANEYATLQLRGPSVDGATDRLSLLLNSQNNDGTSEANLNVSHSALGGLLILNELVASIEHARLQVAPDASALPVATLSADASHTGNVFQAGKGTTTYAQISNDGRTLLTNMSSASSALFVNTAAGHTGNMLRLQLNGTDMFVIDNNGVVTVDSSNTFTTYTPTVTGGGTATFSTRTGWWQRVGKKILFTAYLVVNAAGSGAAVVQVTAPTSIDRTTRQRVGMHGSGLGGPGAGEYTALCFTGGSGATIDRLTRGGVDLTGANLNAGAIITIEGEYREA